MVTYRPVIAPAAADRIRQFPPDLKRAIKEATRAIGRDPGLGDPLERELSRYRKYRVRRFRIIYRVERGARTINIVAVGHRRTVYEQAAERIRGPA